MAEQTVSIECDACKARWSVPVQDIPEDASLTQFASDFLEKHKDCSQGVSIQMSSQRS